MSLRVVFMGTPDFSVPVLSEIVGQGHEVVACYTRPPAPSGRGMTLKPSPIHTLSEQFHIPVFTPKTLRDAEAQATFASLQADVAVVVAYGMILPKPVLEMPRLRCLNLHASLLPRWRGAAPIQRAIMAGDTVTGVAVMRMEEGLDTGPVGMAEQVSISPDTTAGELHNTLSSIGADLMVRALAALSRDALHFTPQPEDGITYAHKITNEEARLDWSRDALTLHNQVRGLSPFPGAYFIVDCGKGPERIKVLRTEPLDVSGEPGKILQGHAIACGTGALKLVQVQRAGRGIVTGDEFIRGAQLVEGSNIILNYR